MSVESFDAPENKKDKKNKEIRRQAHFFVDEMPEDGLEEMIETLKDMYEFYVIRKDSPNHDIP